MAERAISEGTISEAVANPTKVGYDKQGNILIRKLYTRNGRQRLLLLVATRMRGILKIITIIDTSKVGKYL